MDLLGYADTLLDVCLAGKTKREVHDILRQVYVYPKRIRVCPCVKDPWVQKTLEFLGAEIKHESSHPESGPVPN